MMHTSMPLDRLTTLKSEKPFIRVTPSLDPKHRWLYLRACLLCTRAVTTSEVVSDQQCQTTAMILTTFRIREDSSAGSRGLSETN